MKKTLLLSTIGTLALVAGISSCGNTNTALSGNEKGKIEALTSIKMAESGFGGTALRAAKMEVTPELEKDVATILPSLDVVLNAGTVVESTINENGKDVNGVHYAIEETISYFDKGLDKKFSYVMAYNKTNLSDAPATDAEANKEEDKKNDKKQEEIEEEYRLDGVIIMDEQATVIYDFVAVAESEINGQESEFERSFQINIDDKTWIRVEEENEVEGNETEVEFAYTLHKEGQADFTYSISIEDKPGAKKEVEYELNGITYEVKMIESEGTTLYKVEVENANDKEAKLTYKKVTDADGNVSYERVNEANKK